MAIVSTRAVHEADLLSLYSDPDTCPTDDLTLTPLVDEEAFVTWQQDIPRSYMATSPTELDRRIRAAKETLGERLVILGHHYQRDEVIQYADHTGDSFKLARLAQAESAAEYVVFCGVHFMAESADILTPPEVSVILPNMAAGCSMADMAEPGAVYAAWDEIAGVLDEAGTIIPITYMNSAASLKAFVGEREGVVCTSSNAPKTFDYAFERGDKILFFPDQHLGRNTGWDMGIPLEEMVTWDYTRPLGGLTADEIREARVILWKGHCSTHQRFSVGQIEQARAKHPGINVIVHPESSWEVVQAADLSGSTERIVAAISDAPSGSVWGIGTEINLVNRLAQEHPDKTIFCLDPVVCPCSTMYRIHPAYLAWVLEGLVAGQVINEVRVDDETRKWSLVALERMLALP
jgi:quinolinate synthase